MKSKTHTIFKYFALLLVIILLSCKNSSKKAAVVIIPQEDTTIQIVTLSEISDYLSAKPQKFLIDASKDNMINCQQGTKFFFTANSLEFEDGSAPIEEVEVEIKEYCTLGDFIKNNLTTTSGNRILETGGMINISISSKGKQLKMKNGKEYALYFPKKIQANDMKLFYGNHKPNGQIDWKLALSLKTTQNDSKVKVDTAQRYFLFLWNKEGVNHNESRWILKNGQTIYEYFVANFVAPKKMVQDFSSLDKISNLSFKLSSVGKIIDIKFPKESFNDNKKHDVSELEELVSQFINTIPLIDITKIGYIDYSKTYWLSLNCHTIFSEEYKKRFKERLKEKYASFKDKAINKIDKSEMNYFILTANKFDWINCDRFWETPEEKTEFFVNTKSSNDIRIFVVFKNSNSILEGTLTNNKVVFSNIPIGQPVKIIGISYNKGKPTMAIAETTISKTGFELNNFNDFTLTQLETELNMMTR